MRISSPEKLLRQIALDPKASPKHRNEALLAMDCPSERFLRGLLRAGTKKLPASVGLTATAILKTTQLVNKKNREEKTKETQ
jgi:hypothetical protein